MKYTTEQLKRIKEAELKLSGELQKSVWSIMKVEGRERLKNVAIKLGRRNDSVFTTMQKLIEYGMIEKVESTRGEYMVSRSIKEL
jgi:predicted transcriptional regulator